MPGCQNEIAKIIKKNNEADYVLAVKEQLKTSGCYLLTFEKAHGQLETIEYYKSSDHWLLDVIFKEDANITINNTAVMNQNVL